jgi:hypothetical protein
MKRFGEAADALPVHALVQRLSVELTKNPRINKLAKPGRKTNAKC